MWFVDRLFGRRIERETDCYLRELAARPVLMSRARASRLLEQLAAEPGPKVTLGETLWGQPVAVPVDELVKAHGLVTGGTGSGKTMFACGIIEAIVEHLLRLQTLAFGVLDPKGDLFDRTLYLLARRLRQLRDRDAQALRDRIVIIDFSCREAITSYNILARWPHAEPDFFVTSRLETLRELLPSGEKFSLRGGAVLRHVLTLLSEFGLPLTYLDRVLSDETVRARLLARSQNAELKLYFQHHFPQEGRQTLEALRVRMESLFASEGVRLALSGSSAPDLRRLQDEGKIILVNYAGPTITRGVRLLLQGLVLSDDRQAIFAGSSQPRVSYLKLTDEAQNQFLTRQQQENMADILTMSRSFGQSSCLLCQNLTTAVPDSRVLETVHTNIRWSMTMRGTPRDALFLKPALPVTGQRQRPEANPFREPATYSPEEERSLALDDIAHLPDREGYLWLKARSGEALRLRTRDVELPQGEEFRRVVEEARRDTSLGGRVSRVDYERFIKERDREWLEGEAEPVDFQDRLARAYREDGEQP